MPAKQKKTAMEYAVSLLGLRAYSTTELRKKLFAKEYPAAEIRNVIEQCTQHGFLNDAQFAGNLAANIYARGSGRRKAMQKLRSKGIAQDIIQETLAETDENTAAELDAARHALSRRRTAFAREPDARKRREKMLRFLAGRGFSAAIACDAIRKELHERNDDETF